MMNKQRNLNHKEIPELFDAASCYRKQRNKTRKTYAKLKKIEKNSTFLTVSFNLEKIQIQRKMILN